MRHSYNFDPRDAEDHNWERLYTVRRRDALFAFTIPESQGSAILGRDHLGAVPLFYRTDSGSVESSTHLADLVRGTETLNEEGLTTFVALGTPKLVSLFNEIHIVPHGTVLRVHPSGESEVLYRYTFRRVRHALKSFTWYRDTLDRLLTQAARRALRDSDTVGLYLSGGVDSGLTASYLVAQGATVHAYTTTPWGAESAEGKLAKQNAARAGTHAHTIVPFDTSAYARYASGLAQYANPCGATSMLAISCIALDTPVLKESHIFFAQNADTATGSVADQSLLYFASFLPSSVRRYAHRLLSAHSLLDNFVALRTTGLIMHSTILDRYTKGYSRLEQLTLAGMLFAHSPVDGDIVIQPTLAGGQRISNLFYDIDVVEFLMGLPLRHRISLSTQSKFFIELKKRILKSLARGVLPDEVIDRKKGLTVPLHKDVHARDFFEKLPTGIGARALSLPQHRFAAHMLERWARTLPHAPKALLDLFTHS
jgi:asparagine synthase (glutamine-hydrolysing)